MLRCIAHYSAGNWDEAERVASTADERRPAVSGAALYVEVGRGRASADERLARLAPYRTSDPYVAYLAGGCEADLMRWQGRPERSSELARETLKTQEEAGAPWVLSAIWPAALALAAEGDLAERARAGGDQAAVKEHQAVGEDLLARACSALQRARDRGRQVGLEALAWLARAEAEWTRVEGRPDPVRWAAAADAFGYGYLYEEARCRWRLAEALLGEGRREEAAAAARAAHEIAERLGAGPLLAAVEALARRGRLDLGVRGPGQPSDVPGLTPASWRCCAWWPPAAPTARSPRPCSSAARRPASTSPTSWPSWACAQGPRRPPQRTAWGWTTPPDPAPARARQGGRSGT